MTKVQSILSRHLGLRKLLHNCCGIRRESQLASGCQYAGVHLHVGIRTFKQHNSLSGPCSSRPSTPPHTSESEDVTEAFSVRRSANACSLYKLTPLADAADLCATNAGMYLAYFDVVAGAMPPLGWPYQGAKAATASTQRQIAGMEQIILTDLNLIARAES